MQKTQKTQLLSHYIKNYECAIISSQPITTYINPILNTSLNRNNQLWLVLLHLNHEVISVTNEFYPQYLKPLGIQYTPNSYFVINTTKKFFFLAKLCRLAHLFQQKHLLFINPQAEIYNYSVAPTDYNPNTTNEIIGVFVNTFNIKSNTNSTVKTQNLNTIPTHIKNMHQAQIKSILNYLQLINNL
jgi:hypothetical protein